MKSKPQAVSEQRKSTRFQPGNKIGNRFKPGQSGNPGGRPKQDLPGEIARAIFEGDAEAIRDVFRKELRKGNHKLFEVLADRGYGKVKQGVELSGPDGDPIATEIEIVLVDPKR